MSEAHKVETDQFKLLVSMITKIFQKFLKTRKFKNWQILYHFIYIFHNFHTNNGFTLQSSLVFTFISFISYFFSCCSLSLSCKLKHPLLIKFISKFSSCKSQNVQQKSPFGCIFVQD